MTQFLVQPTHSFPYFEKPVVHDEQNGSSRLVVKYLDFLKVSTTILYRI